MNNRVFGKTMENIRNGVDVKLFSKGNKCDKLIAKPNFRSGTIITKNLVAIHISKTKNIQQTNTYRYEYIGLIKGTNV
jgi:hypothetical protein